MTANKSVPFFDYSRVFSDDRDSLIRIFDDIGQRGAFIMQQDVRDFESSLCEYTTARYAIGVANATDGLELAWMSLGLQPGEEVIISSHTMLATASSIVTAGGVPVPVEVGDDNLISAEAVGAAVTKRTVGIMPTQLNGRTCDMEAIMGIAQTNGLFVVEDAAQALGSRYKGQHAGTFGDAAAFSFFPAKVLGCLGDGGAVVTNDPQLHDRVYQLHDHGRDIHGETRSWGRNSRLDNLQAAILNNRLRTYEESIIRRRAVAAMYHQLLSDLEELELPPSPDSDERHFDVYQNYELQADQRDELQQHLSQHGIGTLVQWGGKAVHQWERLGFTMRLPRVERFFERCLMLPMNTFISDDDVTYIAQTIRSYYRA